ncbi:protein halfway isoform X2 [Plodia interpunctella]|uniref:protein halfway isoform X2 n=1 Tax=Plodia interpunctella TaxID=58824 RepID=UPI002367D4B5|nr:protein halfway isoform X2 [Plodia interpunctella]
MKLSRVFDVTVWLFVLYLTLHFPTIETRVDDFEQQAQAREQPPASTPRPEPPNQYLNHGKCFHMPREKCPEPGTCTRVSSTSVFCCDLDSAKLKEDLISTVNQNTTNLHILNATIDELDISQAVFRRLTSMALTDGNIGKIVDMEEEEYLWPWGNYESQFPKYSALACLNISNNNLTSDKLPSSSNNSHQRPFAYLFNLTVLDASANNLTKFPLSLVHSNKKIMVDFSGNRYLPCKEFQKAMESSSNTSSLVTFLNYNDTYCALDLEFNWFKDVKIVQIDHLRIQKELNVSCSKIKPPNINCTCIRTRLELTGDDVTNLVGVDCSERHLTVMPTGLPPNTVKLNVSHNNITSLQAVGDDPTYEHLRQLIVDYNDIENIVELEGTKFIENFLLFSIGYNKLKTIHTYILSNRFDSNVQTFSIAGNHIHCDCNTEKTLKPWLQENLENIPDYKLLLCTDGMGPVVDLVESHVCHTVRDWTDYIYYIIGLEVLILVLLISKVSYDYWVFKTAGYLPWPANKMPRLPCDWLCE